MSEKNIKLLKKSGLKITEPRLKILALMQRTTNTNLQHFSAEDIYKMLLEEGEEIGLATVYRVLNQFDEVGILTRHNFEGNKSLFELAPERPHDHIICTDCGKVMEFSDDLIERRQREISEKFGMELETHSLYLYGKCNKNNDCDENKK